MLPSVDVVTCWRWSAAIRLGAAAVLALTVAMMAARGLWALAVGLVLLGLAAAAAWLLRRAARLAAERAAARARREFLDGMSHELRTPLNSVIGFSTVLLRSDGLSPRDRQYLERVRANGERLLAVVERLLSRAEGGAAGDPSLPTDRS